MKNLVILVGPPGSGKSTLAKKYEADGFLRISQDRDGADHVRLFLDALDRGDDIVVDRMNFNVEQRARYSRPASFNGYDTEIVVLHEAYNTCLNRMRAREGHETITDEKGALGALRTFFTKYERPTPSECFNTTFIYPEGPKPKAIICDLDGTLCNVEHRRHFVRGEGKKNWKGFFEGIADDTVNVWCKEILESMLTYQIVFCSGRGQEHEEVTRNWLNKNAWESYIESELYMRMAGDSRQDYIVKEIILDFEILTRWTPHFMIDDRQQVVDMWRRRGFTCLQCDIGDF